MRNRWFQRRRRVRHGCAVAMADHRASFHSFNAPHTCQETCMPAYAGQRAPPVSQCAVQQPQSSGRHQHAALHALCECTAHAAPGMKSVPIRVTSPALRTCRCHETKRLRCTPTKPTCPPAPLPRVAASCSCRPDALPPDARSKLPVHTCSTVLPDPPQHGSTATRLQDDGRLQHGVFDLLVRQHHSAVQVQLLLRCEKT